MSRQGVFELSVDLSGDVAFGAAADFPDGFAFGAASFGVFARGGSQRSRMSATLLDRKFRAFEGS